MKLNTIPYYILKRTPYGEDADGGDSGNSNNGGDAGATSFTQADLDAAVTKAVDAAKREASDARSQMAKDLKAAKDKAKQFDGIDPDAMKNMMAQFENDQDLKDIAEGKFQDVLDRKLERQKVESNAAYDGLKQKYEEAEQRNADLSSQVSDLLIDNNIVGEFVKQNGVKEGVQDVVLRAKNIFKEEDGELIPRDAKGEIIPGQNGVMTPQEWITGLKESAPHLFPQSTGSGANGGQGSGGSSFDNKIKAAASSNNQEEYRRLRRAQKEAKNKK